MQHMEQRWFERVCWKSTALYLRRAFRNSQKALESCGKACSDTVNTDQKPSALPMSLKKRLALCFLQREPCSVYPSDETPSKSVISVRAS